MTWQARDSLPVVRREKVARAPVKQPGAPNGDAPPAKIPTYTQQSLYRLEDDGPYEYQFSQEQERALIAEGIWPERHWSIWKHAMTRGIDAY